MDIIKSLIKSVPDNFLLIIRYLLIFIGLSVLMHNVIDCVYSGFGWQTYILNIGVLGAAVILLIAVPGKGTLYWIIGVCGLLAMYDNYDPTSVHTIGILFVLFSLRIANKWWFTLVMGFGTVVSIILNHLTKNVFVLDSLNIASACFGIYIIDYLLFNYLKGVERSESR